MDWKRKLNKIQALHNFIADVPPKDNIPLCKMQKAAHGGQAVGGLVARRWD
jgi:hypothetical protein